MRKMLFVLLTVISCCRVFAQGVGIGTGTPDSSSILDLTSVTQGLLLPRMTQAQILAIPLPAEGLMAYNTSLNKPVFYNGTKWKLYNDVDMEIKLGDAYGGGIVVYLDETKIHGIIAAAANITFPSPGTYAWGCSGTAVVTSTALGTGQANTNAILAACASTSTAAYVCNFYVVNGYNDWYLPSRDEFAKMCQRTNLALTAGNYATSSQGLSPTNIYYFVGSPCTPQINGSKTELMYVRPVRSF